MTMVDAAIAKGHAASSSVDRPLHPDQMSTTNAGTFAETEYDWPNSPLKGGSHGQRLQVGDVVLANSGEKSETWWLVIGPSAQIGQNAVLVHGPLPRKFGTRFTHWSDDVVGGQNAIVNPPLPHWPDEVCVAMAAFKLTGKVPGGE
jgi:hypothetical protein